MVLGHRRLAVVDPTPAGRQPMVDSASGGALVYNGELYNDHELRRELASHGVRFTSSCDAETVLHAVSRWGVEAGPRLRGMYALAFADPAGQRMLLGRDPLGIKPLYCWVGAVPGGHEIAFASEVPALLEHPTIRARPNPRVISAYLTTIRTTLGPETLYEGILTLRPGEWIEIDLAGPEPRFASTDLWDRLGGRTSSDVRDATGAVRQCVDESVRRHLRSDVGICSLLSGGLDSTIIAGSAAAAGVLPATYAAGASPEGSDALSDAEGSDLVWAARVADAMDLDHTTVEIDRERFAASWAEMIVRLGVPLSTPNEVAILAVSERLRADGHVVALSGEGADELFAGYEIPTMRAMEYAQSGGTDGGLFTLDDHAWVSRTAKPGILSPQCWEAAGRDTGLVAAYRSEFEALRGMSVDRDPLAPLLAMQRRINLSGLLARLDTATMLAGVEGRTPFADIEVAVLAESLPIGCKFLVAEPIEAGGLRLVGDEPQAVQTKAVLREAFADRVPGSVRRRAKASFPLPFQAWLGDQVGALSRSEFASAIFTPQARAEVTKRPEELWSIAWPMINLALWGERVWG